MGKSPGKWIKSILLGRKSSKSKLSKQNDILKSANNGGILVSSKAPQSDITADHSTVPQLAPLVGVAIGVDSENVVAAKLPNEGFASLGAQEDKNAEEGTNLDSQEDHERIRHETAATKAQAAFRGYQARRAFRSLKGIIRLQALIRGHLVRRQAIATLCCVWAIVKLQALARGKKIRRSSVGIEVQNACNLGKIQGTVCSDSSGICTSTLSEKLIKNAFTVKLLASSYGSRPLSLQYSPEEHNSSREWLERWTKLRFWESYAQQKKNAENDMVQKVETGQGRRKRSVRKLSHANAENSSGHSNKDSEKPKRNPRKLSSHPTDSVQEQSQNGIEKVNRSTRKVSDSTKEARERLDVDNGKPKRSVRKSSTVTSPEVRESTNDMVVAKASNVDAITKLPAVAGHVGALQEHHDLDSQPMGNNSKLEDIQEVVKQLNHEEYDTGNENQKISDRRASFPLNIENQENGVRSTPKVPSYMAPTESARAKLRGQGSPRFSQDAIENIGITRRHSLPSSTNGKLASMSPRAQKLVNSAGKGGMRSDRSLSGSRDGSVSDKAVKADWRR
ncbi:hypothetical protein JCGZ_21686 [Jatropha curcas]|uniref:DUF4005 domain-containing protein n=1 Tax=Jatropha curcas TaxID=180498 RepID=A0A067JMK3_JATCU|nr:protein IQ-DOMAIN 31 [Jatropha curcas]XP_012091921.1 protein IQ-DOMAIN 31 [Jatropha curcas]XP_012091922.1 protein IQ-DOMAIN 31 [Jatropha curcas]XP_020541116.1 protein IQ-DOMAIN 31 [Jatropha curcas]KDP21215.1 hypothetical protein JCGZ_21686 [Jatropha curcas]